MEKGELEKISLAKVTGRPLWGQLCQTPGKTTAFWLAVSQTAGKTTAFWLAVSQTEGKTPAFWLAVSQTEGKTPAFWLADTDTHHTPLPNLIDLSKAGRINQSKFNSNDTVCKILPDTVLPGKNRRINHLTQYYIVQLKVSY